MSDENGMDDESGADEENGSGDLATAQSVLQYVVESLVQDKDAVQVEINDEKHTLQLEVGARRTRRHGPSNRSSRTCCKRNPHPHASCSGP